MGSSASGGIYRQTSTDSTYSTSSTSLNRKQQSEAKGEHHDVQNNSVQENGPVEGTASRPANVWIQMKPRLNTDPVETETIVKRRGPSDWHTIRIFVSSTSKDFHDEREVLIKQVFQDLRLWCQERHLRLMDIDLRWGVPRGTDDKTTLLICLEEIDRCTKENIRPYFISLVSARAGWVPKQKDIDPDVMSRFEMTYGLSITEMEIVHGALKLNNPNAIFLLREDSFLKALPDKVGYEEGFQLEDEDKQKQEAKKLLELKQQIKKSYKFFKHQVLTYTCNNFLPDRNPRFDFIPETIFKDEVLQFFKDRIEHQYPESEHAVDVFKKAGLAHESFMKMRLISVLGRDDTLKEMMSFLTTGHSVSPLLVVGGPGTGKSAIIALAVNQAIKHISQMENNNKKWRFFYHFVGAVPRSTELKAMLDRLLIDLDIVTKTTLPLDLNSAAQLVSSVLRNPDSPSIVVMVDAVNQFDVCSEAELVSWIPHRLAPQVRCILSMIPGTPQHKNLKAREPRPAELTVRPLTRPVCKEIVQKALKEFNKSFSDLEMKLLLKKGSHSNPLWLSIACEELHVFGKFRRKVKDKEKKADEYVYFIPEKIRNFPDSLEGLLSQVLDRLQEEGEAGPLIKATLCLLEVSKAGLVEDELLLLLGDLFPTEEKPELEKGEKEKSKRKEQKFDSRLPSMKWALVQRALSRFLRPFGSLGEGRLDFYHRSMSKVVRERYLHQEKGGSDDDKLNLPWHQKLADLFDHSKITPYYRKAEELPYHLIRLKDVKRLETFLSDWKALDELLDVDLSTTLFSYWRECGDADLVKMKECYSKKLVAMETDGGVPKDELSDRMAQVSRLFVQAGYVSESLTLAEKVLSLENNELKAHAQHTERLANIYSLLAIIYDKRARNFDEICAEQLPDVEACIEHNRKAIEMLEEVAQDDKQRHTKPQLKLGKQKMALAFALSQLDRIKGDEAITINNSTANAECRNVIKETKELFQKLGDLGSESEAAMIDATACWRPKDKAQERKSYEEAWALCQQNYGRYHLLASRIQHYWASAYWRTFKYKKSYEHHKQSFLIKYVIFGPTHETTERALDYLGETDEFKKYHNKDTVMRNAMEQ